MFGSVKSTHKNTGFEVYSDRESHTFYPSPPSDLAKEDWIRKIGAELVKSRYCLVSDEEQESEETGMGMFMVKDELEDGDGQVQGEVATYDPKGLFDDDSASDDGDMWTAKKERKAGANTKNIFDCDSDSGDLFSAK